MPKPPRLEQPPPDVPRLLREAGRFLEEGRRDDAERVYQAVLETQPDHVDALHFLGVLRLQRRAFDAAEQLISRAIGQGLQSAEAHFNLGLALTGLRRYEGAVASFDRALDIRPDYADALNDRGVALARLGRHEAAIASFDRALDAKRDFPEALVNRGIALGTADRFEEALSSFEGALALRPGDAYALAKRGKALQALNRYEQAIASYERALAARPADAETLNNRGVALQALNRYEQAIASYDKALSIQPDYRYALGNAAYCRAQICDWRNREDIDRRLGEGVRGGNPVTTPFPFLAFSDSPADQLACARTFIRNRFPPAPRQRVSEARRLHGRVRIAYLSADFHDHATSYLMAGLFERHDRKRFETIGVSFGSDSQSAMRARLIAGLERFVDVRALSDESVARWLQDAEVDIAVDLKGYTRDARIGILARRPAPIQVSYLGFPGTMGAEHIDYIIADGFVIPADQQVHYAEKIARLPGCYYPNDVTRRIAERVPSRGEAGLPDSAFVFCCFNASYKCSPRLFDIWMRLMHRVEHSVLWLLGQDAVTTDNLRREARARGIDPDRLVFAPKVEQEEHLARHRLADLFLDTLPYNAHTTASDALWAGLPVVTCVGETFVGRVAGSLLHALGLPELVTYRLADYEALAVRLATEKGPLRRIRDKLARNRLEAPLFDTDRLRRHMEAAYLTMWECYLRGDQPRSFAVPPVDA
jgi:predicted O-linked N-acetylglucosamine transferase (SPINDLY family)